MTWYTRFSYDDSAISRPSPYTARWCVQHHIGRRGGKRVLGVGGRCSSQCRGGRACSGVVAACLEQALNRDYASRLAMCPMRGLPLAASTCWYTVQVAAPPLVVLHHQPGLWRCLHRSAELLPDLHQPVVHPGRPSQLAALFDLCRGKGMVGRGPGGLPAPPRSCSIGTHRAAVAGPCQMPVDALACAAPPGKVHGRWPVGRAAAQFFIARHPVIAAQAFAKRAVGGGSPPPGCLGACASSNAVP